MSDSPNQPQNQKTGRIAIVSVMLLSLMGAAGTRYWADDRRQAAVPTHGTDVSGTSLSSLSSFSLGLLLGGLRGPLVMILWTQSETQKTEKNLEGVDTQIELIRLLQPEFDTVHIFQIWNKAYNISVQMASKANKYIVILSALDYGYNVDASKPDDINIVAAIGQLFFDKLGTSSEKYYYRNRVRQETLPRSTNSQARRQDPGWRRTQLDPVLDESFNVLQSFTTPKKGMERPANLANGADWDDGSQLQYLPQFAPYPDGVSTFAFAYNYYKRCQILQDILMQRHDQLSDLVIESRPALSLKFWAEDELEQGHRRELQAFGIPVPENNDDIGVADSDLSLTQPVKDANDISLAIAGFNHAVNLFPASLSEYVRTILRYPQNEQQYRSYMQEEATEFLLATGDFHYLTAMTLPPANRANHYAKALAAYNECRHMSTLIILRYYIDRSFVAPSLPPGFGLDHTADHKGIEELDPMQALTALNKADTARLASKNPYVNEDRFEFDRFNQRSLQRGRSIAIATGAVTNKPPH